MLTVGEDELKDCYLNEEQDNKVPVSDFEAHKNKLEQLLENACEDK